MSAGVCTLADDAVLEWPIAFLNAHRQNFFLHDLAHRRGARPSR